MNGAGGKPAPRVKGLCGCKSIPNIPARWRRATSAKWPSAARPNNATGYRGHRVRRQPSSAKTSHGRASRTLSGARFFFDEGYSGRRGNRRGGFGNRAGARRCAPGVSTPVIHLAGITKAFLAGRNTDVRCWSMRRPPEPWREPCKAVPSAWCTSAAWLPSDPVWMAALSMSRPFRIRSAPTASPNWKGSALHARWPRTR